MTERRCCYSSKLCLQRSTLLQVIATKYLGSVSTDDLDGLPVCLPRLSLI